MTRVYSLGGVLLSNLNNDSDPKLLELAAKSSRHRDISVALFNVSQELQVLTESEQMARYRINLEYINRDGQPEIHIGERIRQFAVSFYFQENSPYKDPIDRALSVFWESGINNKILYDALSRIEVKKTVEPTEKLGLETARPAFVVLVLFGGISCLVLAFEIMLKPRKRNFMHIDDDVVRPYGN